MLSAESKAEFTFDDKLIQCSGSSCGRPQWAQHIVDSGDESAAIDADGLIVLLVPKKVSSVKTRYGWQIPSCLH